jgi:predicted DNA binding protein
VAASLGVSPPTFHQHLRTAERKVFDSLLATPRESLRTDGAGGR